jgi:uncharacterized membrane protein YraQ (UPF0718 family)/copper chaperone CopZ
MIYEVIKEIAAMFIEMSPYIVLGLFFVGLLNLFINKELIIKHTGGNNFLSVLKAALFGIPLPLCSCGVIPTSVFIYKNGASKSSTVSFLTSTPQTGIDSIIATYGMMGPVFAVFRPFAALAMGIISGIMVKLTEKKKKQSFISLNNLSSVQNNKKNESAKVRIKKSFDYAFVEFLDDISVQFIAGVIIAGLISYFLPADLIADLGIGSGLIAMLLITLVAAPMYVCATASIPIAVALMMKGFSPGVAFVFLAVGPATNAASLSILFNTIGKKSTLIYLISLIVSSVLFGYLLDFIFNYFGLNLNLEQMHSHTHETTGIIMIVISVIFAFMLLFSFKRKYFYKLQVLFKKKQENIIDSKSNILKVEGMTCNHCVSNVKNAILSADGVTDAIINLEEGKAEIKGNYNTDNIIKRIENVGYKAQELK